MEIIASRPGPHGERLQFVVPLVVGELEVIELEQDLTDEAGNTVPAVVATHPTNPARTVVRLDISHPKAIATLAEAVAELCRCGVQILRDSQDLTPQPQPAAAAPPRPAEPGRQYGPCVLLDDDKGLCPCCSESFADPVAFRAHLYRTHGMDDAQSEAIIQPVVDAREGERVLNEGIPAPVVNGKAKCPCCFKPYQAATPFATHLRKCHDFERDEAEHIASGLLQNRKHRRTW